MGFLSSLFGGGGSKPATTTQVTTSKLPDEIAPKVQEIADEAKRLYDERVAEGYVPYAGATIAPYTQQELDSQAAIEGLVGTSVPLQQEALGITRQAGEQFTGDVAQQYMNPYQQAVIDIEKRKAQEDFTNRILPQFEKQGVAAGGMSGLGSRAGVQAALLGEAQSQRLGDIQSKGLQQSFLQGRQEFNAQKIRERQQAQDLNRAGPAMFASGLAEQGALAQVGEGRRGLAQEALDEAYFRFLEERNEPQAAIGQYSSTIYANPLSSMPQTTSTGAQRAAQPSTGSQLLGLGLQAANIYGMGGGSAFGGGGFSMNNLFNKAEGGRINDGLSGMVYRQTAGQVSSADRTVQDIINDLVETDIDQDPQGRFPEGVTQAQIDASKAAQLDKLLTSTTVAPPRPETPAGLSGIATGPSRGKAGEIFKNLVNIQGLPSNTLESQAEMRIRTDADRAALAKLQGQQAFDREAQTTSNRQKIDVLEQKRYDDAKAALEKVSYGNTLGSQLLGNISASLMNPDNTIAMAAVKGSKTATDKWQQNQKQQNKLKRELNDAQNKAQLARLEKRSTEDINSFDKIALLKIEQLTKKQGDEASIVAQAGLIEAANTNSIKAFADVANTLAKSELDRLNAEAALARARGEKGKNRQQYLKDIEAKVYSLAKYKLVDGQWSETETTIKGLTKDMLLRVINQTQKEFLDGIESGNYAGLADAFVEASGGVGGRFDTNYLQAIISGEAAGFDQKERALLPNIENISSKNVSDMLTLFRNANQEGRKKIVGSFIRQSGGTVNTETTETMTALMKKALRRSS